MNKEAGLKHGSQNNHLVVIENGLYRVNFDPDSGVIVRVYDKIAGLDLITEPALADNFRICMALPKFQAAYIIGKDQRLTLADQTQTAVTLTWDGPFTDQQGVVFPDISATMKIELKEERIEFQLDVHNHTPHRMYEVWYPIIGGMTGIGDRKETRTYLPGPDLKDLDQQLFWNFQTRWGLQAAMRCPELFFKHPEHLGTLWVDIHNPRLGRGIYFGHLDRSPLSKVFRAELQPGVASFRAPRSSWPRPQEVDRRFPVGLNIEWLYLPDDLKPRQTFSGAPVVLQCHEGGWEQAASLHKALGGATDTPPALRKPDARRIKTNTAGVCEIKNEKVRLENALYLVEIDCSRGAIRRLFDKVGGVELITEPRVAHNFALSILIDGMEQDQICGADQSLSSFEKKDNVLRLQWDGPLTSDAGASYEIAVEMEIRFVESQVEFRMQVDNLTAHTVSQVWYPIIGGIQGIGGRAQTRSTIQETNNRFDWYLATPIDVSNEGADIVSQITRTYVYEERNSHNSIGTGMPWVDIYNIESGRGLYFASHDMICRTQALRFEKRPGVALDGGWDYASPIGYMHCIYHPYIRQNETFDGPAVVFRFHEGDWHDGARIYRAWFTSAFKIRDPRQDWLRQEMAYQSSMFLLSEAERIYWRFEDIPRWAKGAKDHGVNAVHVAGWMEGGHYADQPSYRPDPRLGTWEDLAAAIGKCHQMGVKVIFFVNTFPLCMDSDWYDQELHKYRAINEQGQWYRDECAGCGTVYARLITARALPWKPGRFRMTVNGSIGIAKFRELLVRQFRKLAEIGADGLHVDQFTGFGFDFNPLLEIPPDRAVSEGQLKCMAETLDECRKVNPDFSVSMESGSWDRALQYGNVAWAWIPNFSRDHYVSNIMKYTFPQWVDSCAVFQPYDYNVVNNAVRYGFFLHIAFGNWTSYMGDDLYKPLSSYIKEIQRIREELKETIYMGEYLDHLEADVEVTQDMRYGVHRNTESGQRAVVVVNFDAEPHELSLKSFHGNTAGSVYVYAPFKQRAEEKLPVTVSIPGERLAIVIEA